MICEQVSNAKFYEVNILNVVCSIILFTILLFKTKNCRAIPSSSVPLRIRGNFYKNVQKLSTITYIWNWMWIVYQALLAMSLLFKTAPFSYTLMIIKGVIWLVAIYLEFSMFFFVSASIDITSNMLKILDRAAIIIAISSAIGSILIDLLVPNSYDLYDLSWSALRIGISLLILRKKRESWSIFMVLVYLMNSIQELMHNFNTEYFYCARITTKMFYFIGLVPVLYYTLDKNNEEWNRVMISELESVAKEWTMQIEELFPDEEKIGNIAASMRSVQYSPFRDLILDRRDFLDLKMEIGSGTFGHVRLYNYRGKQVAVKFVMSSALISRTDTILSFKLEFFNFLKLQSCKQVVRLIGMFFDIDNSGPKFGIVMEYAKNGTLYANLPMDIQKSAKGTLTLRDDNESSPSRMELPLVKIAHELSLGLQYMHNVLHMSFVDLKPSNIVLDAKFNAKYIDLGSLAACEPSKCPCKSVNKVHTFTEAYAAPELYKDSIASTKADVWSFGLILWQLFTGFKTPFVIVETDLKDIPIVFKDMPTGFRDMPMGFRDIPTAFKIVPVENAQDVMEYYINRQLRPPLPPSMPEELSKIISQCWQINPDERPSINSIVDVIDRHPYKPPGFYQIPIVMGTREIELNNSL